MSSQRRYSGSEIEEIFRRATEKPEATPRRLSGDEGLTLEELKEIGREVGIEPQRVARAAAALDPGPGSGPGFPLSVRRTVPLSRDLTEEEWERLVADLRATFDAPGRVHRHGGLKGWTNGNLHAFVEPTGTGYRLRMGTTKQNAKAFFGAGALLVGLASIVMIVSFLTGKPPDALPPAALLSLMGLAGMAAGALQLPGWARTRRRQMEEIGARLTASLEPLPEGAEEGGAES